MFGFAMLIAGKDLRLAFRQGAPLAQAILLGILLIFIFSLGKSYAEEISPQQAAAIFWLSSCFCQTLIFNQLYALEEDNSTRENLILAPFPLQGIWLGKALAALVLLLVSQIVFFPAIVVFLSQTFKGSPFAAGVALILVDIGMCALGSLMGAIGQGQSGRESLLSIILFPLLIPILLAGACLLGQSFGAPSDSTTQWLGIAGAFDAMFTGAALALFPFLYRGNE